MSRKLAAYRRQNQLDLALQELGQIERTRFMLDWLESPELRRRCHAGLNNSEQRHFLAQVICTFKQGRQTRPANKADCRPQCRGAAVSCLVFWNSTYIADAIAHLRATEQSVPDAWLAQTSPLSWEHISFSGDLLWERAAATADKRRPL
jgi:TnpA family transposase